MSGRLTRQEYDECFAKLFGATSPLRRIPTKALPPRQGLRRSLSRIVRGISRKERSDDEARRRE